MTTRGGNFLSCSHSQELGQRYDWLLEIEEPIRSLVCLLTKLLAMTTTQKFPTQSNFMKFE